MKSKLSLNRVFTANGAGVTDQTTIEIMSGAGRSDVWLYFNKHSTDKAKCKKGGEVISCKGSSTSGLGRHLKAKHSIEATAGAAKAKPQQLSSPVDCEPSTNAGKKQNTSTSVATSSATSCQGQPIFHFMVRETLEEIVSRLIALDGFAEQV